MTARAFAGSRGGRGASGFVATWGAPSAESRRSEWSAIAPNERPQRPRKWRRVGSARSEASFGSTTAQELVEVQDRVRDAGPRREFRGIGAVGERSERVGRHLQGLGGMLAKPADARVAQMQQGIAFGIGG